MTTRFFPASICIRGDCSLTDLEAITEINRRLRWLSDLQEIVPRLNSLDSIWDKARDAGLSLDLPLINSYQLLELDPAQFVGPNEKVVDTIKNHRTIPKITIERAGGYDPRLGPDHPANRDPTLESEHDQYDRATGDLGRPVETGPAHDAALVKKRATPKPRRKR